MAINKSVEIISDKAQLLVIDIQERLCPVMDQAWLFRVIQQVGLMILYAQRRALPITLTEQYPKGLGSTRIEVLQFLKAGLYQEFAKLAFGCGGDAAILTHLKASGKTDIILTGMESHICVTLTALGLLKEGFRVFVCQDAVIARGKANHDNALSLMQQAGAIITNTETLVFQMMGCSGGETFKVVSNYLKQTAGK